MTNPEESWPETARCLLHELRVHQIELELQNEELRQTQCDLEKSRERYFDLYDLAPVGYATLSEAGLILEANLALADLLGVEGRTLKGQAFTRYIHGADQDIFYQHQKTLFRSTEPQTSELRLRNQNGTIFWSQLDSSVTTDTNGKLICRIVTIDISERKNSEATLSESEARYRALIEQSPESVLVCDSESGEVIEVNSRFSEQFGYCLPVDGQLKLASLFGHDQQNIRDRLDKAKQLGVLTPQRLRLLHKNGMLLHVEGTATLVHYCNRTLFAMTLRDVTEAVHLEQVNRHDAQLAARVQKALLVSPQPSKHLALSLVYHPLTYVGGDLYFMDWRYRGEVLRGFLIDTAGHGLGTALHTSAMHVLLREVNDLDLPLSAQMSWLNRRANEYFDDGVFAGALGFELDLKTRQLRWVCAGMPELWVSSQTHRGVFKKPGMYLGMMEDEFFETHTLPLAVGDSLYLLTDGLTDLLTKKLTSPLEQYAEMVTLLRNLTTSQECRDDATAICIRILSFPDAPLPQAGWPRTIRFSSFGDYQRLKGEVAHILAEATGKSHSVQEVAVNEALANALECRDGVPRQQQASLRFNKIGNRLIVRAQSSRIGFAGNAMLRRLRAHPEDLFSFGEDASMGRGIPIMLSLAHQMMYNSEGTEVLLAWRLPGGFINHQPGTLPY